MSTVDPVNRPLASNAGTVDLFELWEGLLAEKIVWLKTVVFVVLLAVLYLIFAPKTYQTEVSILPPLEKDLASLQLPDMPKVTPEQVYQRFIQQLESPELFYALLKQSELQPFLDPSLAPDQQAKKLKKVIHIELPTEKRKKVLMDPILITSIVAEGDSAEFSYQLAKQVLALTREATEKNYAGDAISLIQKKLENVQVQIQIEEQAVKTEMLSEITRLKNEIEVAQALTIQLPTDPMEYAKERKVVQPDETKAFSEKDPFWLGEKVLLAKKVSLEKRLVDKQFLAYSEKLRELTHQKVALQESLQQIKNASFKVYQEALNPVIPSKPVKPKILMTLLIALLIGVFLGLFVALIRRSYLNRQ